MTPIHDQRKYQHRPTCANHNGHHAFLQVLFLFRVEYLSTCQSIFSVDPHARCKFGSHPSFFSDNVRDKKSHRLPCKLSGRLREELACWEVQTALWQRTLDHGGGRDSESENARQSGGGDFTATIQRATASQNEQAGHLVNKLRTLRYDTPKL